MPKIDLTTFHFLLSLIGCLLAVYWSLTLAADPAGRHIPFIITFARRCTIFGIGTGMLMADTFGHSNSWEPWPPYVAIIGSVDLYFLMSIVSAHLRFKTCVGCPLLPPEDNRGIVERIAHPLTMPVRRTGKL